MRKRGYGQTAAGAKGMMITATGTLTNPTAEATKIVHTCGLSVARGRKEATPDGMMELALAPNLSFAKHQSTQTTAMPFFQ